MNQKRFKVKKFVAVLKQAEAGISVIQSNIHMQKKIPGREPGEKNSVPTESQNICSLEVMRKR